MDLWGILFYNNHNDSEEISKTWLLYHISVNKLWITAHLFYCVNTLFLLFSAHLFFQCILQVLGNLHFFIRKNFVRTTSLKLVNKSEQTKNILRLGSSEYIFEQHCLQKNNLNAIKVFFYDIIGCFIGVYNFIFLKNSIILQLTIFLKKLTPGGIFTVNGWKCHLKIRTQ